MKINFVLILLESLFDLPIPMNNELVVNELFVVKLMVRKIYYVVHIIRNEITH